ncbi:hypothetical protein TrLO_g1590 [Triparma laevis f. longispina]|uniref:BspA family leucine-rich repeat surface protein n=1 Tax=Triparma laevis f. longispina TaxID=1714387 RepID=A0A9W7F609_9STRA|nr:hypothetical protein TrLO_g1590 [Triparma laevis f. longispina]
MPILKAELDHLGIRYKPRDQKAVLLALISQASVYTPAVSPPCDALPQSPRAALPEDLEGVIFSFVGGSYNRTFFVGHEHDIDLEWLWKIAQVSKTFWKLAKLREKELKEEDRKGYDQNLHLWTKVEYWCEDRYAAEWELAYTSNWDVSGVTIMRSLFAFKPTFNKDLSRWDTSSCKNMSLMFYKCDVFNSEISGWDVSNVELMENIFGWAKSFNQNLASWNVEKVRSMRQIFILTSKFESDLKQWNVRNVSNMADLFYGCRKFTSDLSSWNTTNVRTMEDMFGFAEVFTSDLSGWDISKVSNTENMFRSAYKFNCDIKALPNLLINLSGCHLIVSLLTAFFLIE